MKRTPIKKIGKKGREWQAARRELINEIKNDPNSKLKVVGQTVYGYCPDCPPHFHPLTPDHLQKRSAGGGHDSKNIQWVCNYPGCWCHSKRDNDGDPKGTKSMEKEKRKIETKNKKANWQKSHECKHCKATVSSLLCTSCGKISV